MADDQGPFADAFENIPETSMTPLKLTFTYILPRHPSLMSKSQPPLISALVIASTLEPTSFKYRPSLLPSSHSRDQD